MIRLLKDDSSIWRSEEQQAVREANIGEAACESEEQAAPPIIHRIVADSGKDRRPLMNAMSLRW